MSLNIVEASISELQQALSSGAITSVDLLKRYLERIARYDTNGPCLNSIPLLNPTALEEALASDERRASGLSVRPLEGIPYTLKDSFKYVGMTVACGSPAFKDLMPNENAFVAQKLKEAGAVMIGKTNMPPMAAGGMQRGLYGRAESPYNLDYLTAAFSSGSSNGSATSTAASFAAFGLGSETVSSGRSPASNNGLVCYTPSKGVISCRGLWPLYVTCDVVTPHTRTVEDMLCILDVLACEDEIEKGDFWREQRLVEIPKLQPIDTYKDFADPSSLSGKRIGVPKMYIGGSDPKAKTPFISPAVINLWARARKDLEHLGASVTDTDFPVVTNYEDDSVSGLTNNVDGVPTDWNAQERSTVISYAWDDFLLANGDPNYRTFADVNPDLIFPLPEEYIPNKFAEVKNLLKYSALVYFVRDGNRKSRSIYDIPGLSQAVKALEAQRKRDLEDWMDLQNIDIVVFPAVGDVGRADLEENEESAWHALQNGVRYSNGNRALRHLGVPTVSVCMGIMDGSGMPVNLTFCGKSGMDRELLAFAFAYEQASKRRVAPDLTPPLAGDTIAIA